MESKELLQLKVNMELDRLFSIQQLFTDALEEYLKHHPHIITEGERKEYVNLLGWLFSGEMDALEASPKDYFDLKEKDF